VFVCAFLFSAFTSIVYIVMLYFVHGYVLIFLFQFSMIHIIKDYYNYYLRLADMRDLCDYGGISYGT